LVPQQSVEIPFPLLQRVLTLADLVRKVWLAVSTLQGFLQLPIVAE